ncbi:MAG: hypothetical protein HYY86_01440 [Candidatus Harrisonbacteria bacterium]|nr:hypothetical protein [Candidatus Harrisonbacteria bacterium]
MKKISHLKFDGLHELFANGLVFLSMAASLFLVGIVFISDHGPQIAAFSARANNLSAQIYSVYSGYQNSRPEKQPKLIRPPLRYPDGQLKDQLNKFLDQLEELANLRY